MTANRVAAYPYLRGDGVPAAQPLLQGEGGGSIPTSPLQLHFHTTTLEIALSLNALWHSVLPDLSPFAARNGIYCQPYVAEHDNGYFASAIWSNPPALNRMNAHPDEILELRRLAIADLAPRNTASRMLGWMVRDLRCRYSSVTRFISYQAVDHHAGTIYRAAGWEPVSFTKMQPWAGSRSHRPSRSTQTPSAKVRWERVMGA